MKAKTRKIIEEISASQQIANVEGEANRARSITIGTAFGGTTEVMMRRPNGEVVWCLLQPVEVVELIHQLSANIGCHLALQPRDDFSSWREWRVSEAEKKHLNGWPPFPSDMAFYKRLGLTNFNQAEVEAAIEQYLAQKAPPQIDNTQHTKEQKNETLATEKLKNRRSIKRAAKTA